MKEVIIVDGNKKFNFPSEFKRELDVALYATKYRNQDLCIVIDGHEGAGKSQASRQIGFYCSKVLNSFFDVDSTYNIHHDLDSYIDSCNNKGQNYISILDESRSVLNSKRSLSKEGLRFTNFISECRSKNQVHIIILPSYHDLDRYVAQWRMSILINMRKEWVEDDKVEFGGHELLLGKYKGYVNNAEIRNIYDKKNFGYPKKEVFGGRFDNVEVLSNKGLKAYEQQKALKMIEKYGSEEEKAQAGLKSLDKEVLKSEQLKDNTLSIREVYNLSSSDINAYRIKLMRRFLFVAKKYYDKSTNRLKVTDSFLKEFFGVSVSTVNRYSTIRAHQDIVVDEENFIYCDLSCFD